VITAFLAMQLDIFGDSQLSRANSRVLTKSVLN